MFARTVCINLDRRPDRWEQFLAEYPREILGDVERFAAIDAKKFPIPKWWKQGGGAWGCYRSHLSIIEDCINRDIESVLIFEDDATFTNDFRERLDLFMREASDYNWDWLYLGGQFLQVNSQRPIAESPLLVVPFNVNRTHAYALRGRGLREVYKHLVDTKDWKNGQHVDHHFGRLHQKNFLLRQNKPKNKDRLRIVAPNKWVVGQREGKSDINGRANPVRFWQSDKTPKNTALPFVFVIGLHRSGSSATASFLRRLGVFFGPEQSFVGYEKEGGCETRDLARMCEKAIPFPQAKMRTSEREITNRLMRFINSKQKTNARIAGAKYPHLCALAKYGIKAFTSPATQLKIIHCVRPIEESITSLENRERKNKRRDAKFIANIRPHQEFLEAEKQKLLEQCAALGVQVLDVEFDRLLNDTENVALECCGFLDLATDNVSEAVAWINPDKRSVNLRQQ